MHSVARRYEGCVFDAEATHAMGAAFDRICRLFALRDGDHEIKNFVAVTIVNAASLGERDAEKICAMAIQASIVVLAGGGWRFAVDREREKLHVQV